MARMSEQQPMRIAGTADADERAPIDIDRLTEAELIDLNRRIVERLRMMQQLRAHKDMMQFSVGQRVSFRSNRGVITGVLTRYNRKTVTVIADTGEQWNVSPALLEAAG
jgi:hypothetical protein